MLRLRSRLPKSAFTLVEILIASAVVSVGVIATLSLLTKIVIVNSIEQERARAHQIIAEEMERVHNTLFTQVTSGTEVTIWDNGTSDDTTDDSQGTLTVTISDINGNALSEPPSNPIERMVVEVSLSWNPRGRMSNKIQTETLMAYMTP